MPILMPLQRVRRVVEAAKALRQEERPEAKEGQKPETVPTLRELEQRGQKP